MPSQSVHELLEHGQRSGLFSADATRDLIAQWTGGREPTAEEAAALMVEKNVLTAYQAEQLLAGHADECVVAGRYRLLEKLGAGGMGTVYRAEDTHLGRPVALKVLPAHLVSDPGAVARFRREARALAQVSHPAIVGAYDTGADRGQHFLVMEYVEGKDLARVVREQGRMPPTLAAEYVRQAAQALQHAHDRGLVHRDLKPSNLLLTPQRQVKLLDLGLARFLQDQLGEAGLTREGTGLGTPDYMAPEQFGDARRVDRRADIYSLGCTLYHLLAGQVPFPGSSLTEKAQAHEDAEPPPLEERCPEAPAGLVLVVQRMMAKRPADRFQTAGEVAEALAPHVASSSGSLSELRRTTSWQGSQLSFTVPRPRRRRRLWALAGAAWLALVALALALGWRTFRTTETPSGQGSPNQPDGPTRPSVVTIPNGFTVAKDGTGQFTTIGEALAKVDKPGMTIQVLDDATYREVILLNNPMRYQGLTLWATRRATLALPPSGRIGITSVNVPRLKVRGFRILLDKPETFGIVLAGVIPGVVLEDLECQADPAISQQGSVPIIGISIEMVPLTGGDEPVTVRNCKVTGCGSGIQVMGVLLREQQARACRRIVIRENAIADAMAGIMLQGLVNDIEIVGNKIWNCGEGNICLLSLFKGSSRLLIANNSLKNVNDCLVVTDPAAGLTGLEIRNNLILVERGPDLTVRGKDRDPGLLGGWRIEQNWRQLRPPPAQDPEARAWLPAVKDRIGRIELLSREPASPNFLRPARGSPLATEGAGKDDPTLPAYVGAVPPEGVAAWDWDKTWKARQKPAPPTGSPGEKGPHGG